APGDDAGRRRYSDRAHVHLYAAGLSPGLPRLSAGPAQPRAHPPLPGGRDDLPRGGYRTPVVTTAVGDPPPRPGRPPRTAFSGPIRWWLLECAHYGSAPG